MLTDFTLNKPYSKLQYRYTFRQTHKIQLHQRLFGFNEHKLENKMSNN